MHLQQTSEIVPAKIRISQTVWYTVTKRRTSHREGPWTECAEPKSSHLVEMTCTSPSHRHLSLQVDISQSTVASMTAYLWLPSRQQSIALRRQVIHNQNYCKVRQKNNKSKQVLLKGEQQLTIEKRIQRLYVIQLSEVCWYC